MTGHQGQPVEWRLGCGRVSSADIRAVGLTDVFTPVERAHSGGRHSLQGFAGRLAAKYAVADVLGQCWQGRCWHGECRPGPGLHEQGLLRAIQIVPAPRLPCRDPAMCQRGHPPTVRFEPGSGIAGSAGLLWIDVSISHERQQAFAVALAVFLVPPGDGGR
jgi:holo-[acyl-carrier protein] synthase